MQSVMDGFFPMYSQRMIKVISEVNANAQFQRSIANVTYYTTTGPDWCGKVIKIRDTKQNNFNSFLNRNKKSGIIIY